MVALDLVQFHLPKEDLHLRLPVGLSAQRLQFLGCGHGGVTLKRLLIDVNPGFRQPLEPEQGLLNGLRLGLFPPDALPARPLFAKLHGGDQRLCGPAVVDGRGQVGVPTSWIFHGHQNPQVAPRELVVMIAVGRHKQPEFRIGHPLLEQPCFADVVLCQPFTSCEILDLGLRPNRGPLAELVKTPQRLWQLLGDLCRIRSLLKTSLALALVIACSSATLSKTTSNCRCHWSSSNSSPPLTPPCLHLSLRENQQDQTTLLRECLPSSDAVEVVFQPLAIPHMDTTGPTTQDIGNTFCALWVWLRALAEKRNGLHKVDAAYIELRDDEIADVVRRVQAACDRLQAAELFGPDDQALLAVGGPDGIRKPGFAGWVAAKPAEIRLASILRCCERYVFERGEVCPAWMKPFPTEPVTSVATLASYLDGQMEQWSQGEARRAGNPPATAAEEWRVLDNVQHTLAWFHRRGLIRSLPTVPALRRTRLNAGRCSEILRQALQDLVSGHQPVPSPGDGPRESKCSVVLRGKGERPLVLGREESPVTSAQYDVLQALINAGADGLSMTELVRRSGHGSARNVLKNLANSSSAWQQVILLPGAPGRRYRLLFQ